MIKTILCALALTTCTPDVAYILEWNESSQYARLRCNNFRAPVMVYRIETDRMHAVLGGGWWRYGFTTDGEPLAGCVAA